MKFERTVNEKLREELIYGVHESGLRVYIIPKKGFSKSYAIYAAQYGSLDDAINGRNGEKTQLPDGIAHFLEHKLFEQKDGTNAFDSFALTGASSNAFTSFDMTAYLFACTDSFYENLEILLEFVNNPYFTDENVAKEQGIIGQEIKMYEDDPSWRVFFNMLTAMYSVNPVRKDIAGTVESIAEITPQLLYDCCDAFYNPKNMLLCMVGDVDPDKAAEYIDKYVTNGKSRDEHKRSVSGEPSGVKAAYTEQAMSVSKPIFLIGFKDKREGERGEVLLRKQAVTAILTEVMFGRSGELYTELYSEGLIDSTFDYDTELEQNYGFSSVSGEANDPKAVHGRVLEYVERVKREGLSAEAVERVKRVLIGRELRGLNSVEHIGNDFVRSFMNGINPFDYSSVVESVTMEELTERLLEHFDPDCCVLSVVKPS